MVNVKKAREKFEKYEQKFRDIFDDVIDGVLLADSKTKKFYTGNKMVSEMLGYSKDEIKKLSIYDIHPKKDLPYVLDNVERQLKKEITLARDIPVKRKDGSVFYADVNARPIKVAGKTFLMGVFRDISERRKTQEALEKVNKCFLSFGPVADENIRYIINTTASILGGSCVLYNKEEGPLLCTKEGWNIPKGLKRENRKEGHICYDVITKYKDKPFVVNDLGESSYARTDPNVSKFGLKTYLGNVVKISGKAVGSLCVVYNENVTFSPNELRIISILARAVGIEEERKEAQKKMEDTYYVLKHIQEQLIQSSKMAAMGQLAAGVSSELNKPLAEVRNFILEASADLDKKGLLKEDLKKVIEETERMEKIIKNISLFSGKFIFKAAESDINKIIKDSLMLFEEQFELNNIALRVSLYKNLPKINADAGQLRHAFINLISNAVDAIINLKGARYGKLIVKSFLSKDKENIEIVFKDTGCGIASSNMYNIFNPFYTTKAEIGIGLGLSAVYIIIENHKGKINVKSKEGQGSTFRITLPIKLK